ncbi:MAG: FAD-dependent monooxygenase, partial [Actinomycetota bacterium]
MTDEYEVIIVGAGPVGLSFGNLLGQAGVSTLILEANAGLTADPRAVHYDGEVMRIFQAMGLSDRVAEISLPVPEMNFTDEHDETLFSVNWGPGRGPQGWTPANLFHQPDLEGVLREGLQRWPSVTVGFGATVTAMTQNNGTVEVVAAGETYRASYLVGCDGAGSFTRKSIGSDWIPLGPAQPWVVADGVLLTDRGVLPQWPTQHPWPERPHFFMRNVDIIAVLFVLVCT